MLSKIRHFVKKFKIKIIKIIISIARNTFFLLTDQLFEMPEKNIASHQNRNIKRLPREIKRFRPPRDGGWARVWCGRVCLAPLCTASSVIMMVHSIRREYLRVAWVLRTPPVREGKCGVGLYGNSSVARTRAMECNTRGA